MMGATQKSHSYCAATPGAGGVPHLFSQGAQQMVGLLVDQGNRGAGAWVIAVENVALSFSGPNCSERAGSVSPSASSWDS